MEEESHLCHCKKLFDKIDLPHTPDIRECTCSNRQAPGKLSDRGIPAKIGVDLVRNGTYPAALAGNSMSLIYGQVKGSVCKRFKGLGIPRWNEIS